MNYQDSTCFHLCQRTPHLRSSLKILSDKVESLKHSIENQTCRVISCTEISNKACLISQLRHHWTVNFVSLASSDEGSKWYFPPPKARSRCNATHAPFSWWSFEMLPGPPSLPRHSKICKTFWRRLPSAKSAKFLLLCIFCEKRKQYPWIVHQIWMLFQLFCGPPTLAIRSWYRNCHAKDKRQTFFRFTQWELCWFSNRMV